MLQEFLRGFMRIHILQRAEQGPVYGSELAAELRRHGYEGISPGTLYPALHGLERTGYLVVERRQDGGHWRKFYVLTAKGNETLQQLRIKLGELGDEMSRKEEMEPKHEHRLDTGTGSRVEKAAPERVGDQPDQLLHGYLKRDGHQPGAAVPVKRPGRKDEPDWID